MNTHRYHLLLCLLFFPLTSARLLGVDMNSLVSTRPHKAGYPPEDWKSFNNLTLNNVKNYQVWIDYVDGVVNVTMALVGMKRPNRPLLSAALNLSEVLEDKTYVGFTAATGALITTGLPIFELPKTPGFIAGLVVGVFVLVMLCSVLAFLLIRRNRRSRKKLEDVDDRELEIFPYRTNYQRIESATNNFSEENVFGIGGNGKVYKGRIHPGGSEIAVKRITYENSEWIRAFFFEMTSRGRLKHRNLVGLRGWLKWNGGHILVYDYMENGSLDKRVFECDDDIKVLSYEDRIRILKQVATGLLYLHYGWDAKVLHRNIKASNVLLDKEMNARLGDFELALIHDHDKVAGATRVVGTVGYLAPEVVRSGRASTETDVFSYGVLVLEVICGRRPIEEGKPPLVEWVWELLRKGELVSAVDGRLVGPDLEEVERVLHLGLLCAHSDPKARPTMRQVVKLFHE